MRKCTRIIAVCGLLLSFACLFADDAVEATLARDKAALATLFPRLDIALMMRFYEEYSPDLLEEWHTRAKEHPGVSGDYLKRLAKHFQKLEETRQTDMEEYDRMLEYEVLQRQIRLLGKELRRLNAIDANSLTAEQDALRQTNLTRGREKLKQLLEQAFDESLRQQLYEIDKLESEIAQLRQIVDERKQNREQSIRQRYRQLTGADSMP